MKILYSHYLIDDRHPAARMTQSIAEELRKLGHQVHLHRSRGKAADVAAVVSSIMTPAAPPKPTLRGKAWFLKELNRNRAMFKRDRQIIAEFRPNVILARQDAYCYSMTLAAKRAGVPLITYADAPVAYESRTYPLGDRWHPPKLVESVERWTLSQSRAIITVSRPAVDILAEYGLSKPIYPIPNGIHPEQFPGRDQARRLKKLDDLGISQNKVIIGFQGTFKPFHGLDRLRELMLMVGQSDAVHWLMIGDGPERSRFEQSLQGFRSVTFLGRKPHDEMGEWLSLFDLSISPHDIISGHFYFCPLKILESAAAGAVVVASNQGDVGLWLDEGRAGVIINSNQAEDWAKAIQELVNDRERRTRLSRAAREWVLSRFCWSHTARSVEEVLMNFDA